jgi:hypothetical protein
MKKLAIVVTAALLSLSCAGVSLADEQVIVTKGSTKKPSVMKERIITETASVEAVDQTTRIVTLKGPKGKIFDIKAGDKVRNLDQVKAGDQVNVEYYQSVAIVVLAAGQAPGGNQSVDTLERAKPGEKPYGMVGGQVTVTAKVIAIGKKKKSVTLKGPEGKTLVVKVEDPKNLKNVKVGDEVIITATEALAISVESIKK